MCYTVCYRLYSFYYSREWGLESPAIKHNNSYTQKKHARQIIKWKVCHFWAPRCQETRNAMEHPCAEAAPTVTLNLQIMSMPFNEVMKTIASHFISQIM